MICTKCKTDKPETAEFFPLHNRKKNGLDSWCRLCRSGYRSGIRRGMYRNMICDDDLKDLITANKVCVICGNDGPKLAVDHCHSTNKIRGILCMNCNQGLGKFKDDPELLEFARIYLLSSNNDKEADAYLENKGAYDYRKNFND